MAVRDSTDRDGSVIAVSPDAWRQLVHAMTERTLVFELPCDETSASEARRILRRDLVHYPPDVLDDVVLCACETVTNAVLHSGTAREAFIMLVVVETLDRVRVEVLDEGSSADSEAAGPLDEHGRGLLIVNELSSAMGYYQDDAGQNFWFEMKIP